MGSSSSSSSSPRTSPTSSMWTSGCRRTRRSWPPTAPPREAEAVIREVAGEKLESITAFVGGGGPRFWATVTPEQQQANYAQILVQVKDKHDTAHLIGPLQEALSRARGRGDHRRAPARGRGRGRHPDLHPHLRRGHAHPAPAGRRGAGHAARAGGRAPGARRLGRGELRRAAQDRPRQGQHGRHHQPGRGRGLAHRHERLPGLHPARGRRADPGRGAHAAWRSGRA